MTLAEKTHRARQLAQAFHHIVNLHRVEFSPARPPVLPPPRQPDRAAIHGHYEAHALTGVSVFNFRGRREARRRAQAWTDTEVQRQCAEASGQHARLQADYDDRWRHLCENSPVVVIETLEEAFEDNEVPSAAVGVEGSDATLVVLVPDADMAVPEQTPTTTAAGNLSLKKLSQREREDCYKLYVCGQALVTAREAFAVAPGLGTLSIVVLRQDGDDAYGHPNIVCLFAVKLERTALDGIQWATADAAQIINDSSTDLAANQRGRSRGLSPIDLSAEPGLAKVLKALDVDDLDGGAAGSRTMPSGNVSMPTNVAGAAATAASANGPIYQNGPQSTVPPIAGRNRSGVKAILLVGGISVVLCAAIGTVSAAIGINDDRTPTRTTPAVATPAPSRSAATPRASATATPTRSSTPTPAAPVDPPAPPAPPAPPPPAPPPRPEPEPTQQGVHPGAFCSPKWAFGLTSSGTLMQCKPSATDTRFRWRQV